jgi:GNAT superfamily N-acetyltransferase
MGTPFSTRRAGIGDVDGIAAAHVDSIRTIGATYYPPEIIDDWCFHISGERYTRAMAAGHAFFVAIDASGILGFSSHHVLDQEHRTAVYVRGSAARRGVGTALFGRAEAAAIAGGALSIRVDASLAAVAFYRSCGFVETGLGEHQLPSGRPMACVFMRKNLPVRTLQE